MNEMTLADAVTFHQLTLASEGRKATTQRQYAYFQNVFLRYLDSPTGTLPRRTHPDQRPRRPCLVSGVVCRPAHARQRGGQPDVHRP